VDEGSLEDIRKAAEAATAIGDAAEDLVRLIRAAGRRRWVGIYRVTADEVVNLAWSGPAPPAHPRFPSDRGLTGAAIATRTTVCSNDVANDSRYLTNQPTTGSELIVPILLDGTVVGTLDVEDGHTGAFTAADEALFEEIAGWLSALYDRPTGSGRSRG
jgi:putative methionine-R-sulfoxide reductase with GAF domain